MKTSELLTKAKERINTPEKWCKGIGFQDAFGAPCTLEDAAACCAMGAIEADSQEYDSAQLRALEAFREAISFNRITVWNDAPERTHAEVMAAFDRAIAIAKEKEAE